MPILAASQAVYLCWEDSQMQSVFKRIASSDYDIKDSFITVSYAAIMVDVAVHLIGWASVGSWTHEDIERLEVQSFVHPDYRTRGLGFSLIACVTYGIPNTNIPVAVFQPNVIKLVNVCGGMCNNSKAMKIIGLVCDMKILEWQVYRKKNNAIHPTM